MPTVMVQIKDKKDPDKIKGKKRGRIEGSDGMVFQALPEILAKVSIGTTYEVSYKDEEFNGYKYRVVEHIAPANGEMARAAATAVPNPDYWKSSTPSTQKDDDISVLAIVKEWVSRIPVGDEGALVHALRVARRAWLKSKQPDPKIETRRPEEEFNDEIPGWGDK